MNVLHPQIVNLFAAILTVSRAVVYNIDTCINNYYRIAKRIQICIIGFRQANVFVLFSQIVFLKTKRGRSLAPIGFRKSVPHNGLRSMPNPATILQLEAWKNCNTTLGFGNHY